MNISLVGTQVRNLELKHLSPDHLPDSNEIELDFEPVYPEDEDSLFLIIFNIVVKSTDSFRLSLEYMAVFKADAVIPEDFKKGDFPKVNAPAIAYPFLRSFIATLTSNAGYSTAIMPTINFVGFHKAKSKEEKLPPGQTEEDKA